MRITVNEKIYDFEEEANINNVLNKLGISTDNGIAVALNYAVVAKSKFETTRLKQDDILEIIHATAGG